jgi:imidazolonepropionase-like amidohydrolase
MIRLRALAVFAAAFAAGTSPLASQSVKAFTGLTLIDGTDRPAVPNATVVVRDGKVVAAGVGVAVPAGAERIALDGKFVMPGLVNAHGHVNVPADLNTFAAYGVTTVFSLGGEPESVIAARAGQNSPSLNRSRVWVAGPVLSPRNAEEARTQVQGVSAIKADMVKIRVDDNLGTATKMTPEVYRAVITEAHRLGLRVAVHLFYLADAKDILASGGDFVAHSIRDTDVDDAVIAALKKGGTCVSPTLMREVSTFVYESTPEWFSDPLFIAHANKEWIASVIQPAAQERVRNSASAQRYKVALQVASRNLKKLLDAGVPIAMGTDTGPMGRFQGYFELMELELMAKAGLTPRQVLASATRDAARCMKIDGEVGTLTAGRWADFIALDANPLDNVSNVRKIHSVWIAGNRVAR